MKTLKKLVLLAMASAVILSITLLIIGIVSTGNTSRTTAQPIKPATPSNCRFFGDRHDSDGNFMKLYVVDGTVNLNEFRNLCVEFKKDRSGLSSFQFLVLFDSEQNAVFPKNPYSAQYGLDLEPLEHIKAFYEFNPVNGFSELTTYKQNMATSKPNIEKL